MQRARSTPRGRPLAFAIRALVSVYWVALAVFGCTRLWREGWGATLPVIHAWYLAAIAFLLVWGPATVIASVMTAKSEAKLAPLKRQGPEPYRLR